MAAEVDSSLQLTTQRGPSSDSTRSRGSNARIPALSEESSRAAPNRSVNGAENMSIQCSITDWDPFPHNMENNADKNAQRSLTLSIQRLTWWWETGAMILSLTCAALIVAVLIAMNGKPLRDWRLPIQINSLISVFATIAKSALLLIFAEALSQLKWNHLETSGGTLDQLQAFDSASRGPWGSFVFAVKMRKANFRILATVGATLTVLATAFEPFAQQVIEFPSRVVVMENETAYVRVAEAFYMSSEMGDNEGPALCCPYRRKKVLIIRRRPAACHGTRNNGPSLEPIGARASSCILPHWRMRVPISMVARGLQILYGRRHRSQRYELLLQRQVFPGVYHLQYS